MSEMGVQPVVRHRLHLVNGSTLVVDEQDGWAELFTSPEARHPDAWVRLSDGELINPDHVIRVEIVRR